MNTRLAVLALLFARPGLAQVTVDMPSADLPANVAYNDAAGIVVKRDYVVPKDMWLHGYRIEIIDAANKSVPQEVMHHISVASSDYRELFSSIMMRVAAAGAETGDVRVPRWVGMPLKKGSRLNLDAMLHNPTGQPIEGVTIKVHLYTTSAWSNPDVLPAFPFHAHAVKPDSSWEFDVPPGRSTQSWEGTPTLGGKLVGLGGHLHQYGVSVSLIDVTDNKLLYEGVAKRDGNGDVLSITRSEFVPKSIRIRPDHVYRVTAVYDNPTQQTVKSGGMGIIAGLVIPDSRADWPIADRSNAEFIVDQTRRFASVAQGMQHHGQHQ